MSRVLIDSLTHAYAKCENCINDHFSKTKAFCFINQNPLDKLRYSLVFIKSSVFLWIANFRGLTTGFACLSTLSRTFIAIYICITKNIRFFHPRGYLSLLAIPNTRIFHFLFLLCNRETHFGRCPILLSLPSNTKHSVDLPCTHDIPSNTKHSVDLRTMHSHPFNVMSPCICNTRCHCMLYHVTCIMNATWTTQSTPLMNATWTTQSTPLTGVMDNQITWI